MWSKEDFYCTDCGNTGIRLDGTPCHCQYGKRNTAHAIQVLDVPEQYYGLVFNMNLIPKDCGKDYIDYLSELHTKLSSNDMRGVNILIVSPINHSKTVMAYSVMSTLFRANVPTFPLLTILEYKRVLKALDYGMDTELVKETGNFEKAPIVFVKLPLYLTWDVYALLYDIVQRRSRRNLVTIFLYDGQLSVLEENDKQGVIKNMKGSGKLGTLLIKTFEPFINDNVTSEFNALLHPQV